MTVGVTVVPGLPATGISEVTPGAAPGNGRWRWRGWADLPETEGRLLIGGAVGGRPIRGQRQGVLSGGERVGAEGGSNKQTQGLLVSHAY